MINPLSSGLSGLLAASRALDVTSHNIANVNTEGYTRQRIELGTATPTPSRWTYAGRGYVGAGVEVTGIRQLRDGLIDSSYRTSLSEMGALNESVRAADRLENIIGSLDDGFGADLNRLWASFTDLANAPSDETARAGVLDSARQLAGSLRAAHRQVDAVAAEAAAGLITNVGDVNSLLQRVAELNLDITAMSASGAIPNDLLDARNNALDELARLTGATAFPDGAAINVSSGGMLLVSGGRVSELTVSGNPPSVLSDGQPLSLRGAIGTQQRLSGTGLADLRTRLDLLANGLRDAVNTAHQAGFDPNGNSGVAFFVGTGARDFDVNPLLQPQLVAASASGAPNDGNNALALAGIRFQQTVGTVAAPTTPSRTANQAFADLVSELGRAANVAQTDLTNATATVQSFEARRDEVSGVSIDEEMTEMLRFQRAYQAAARVITTADEMLETIVNRLGLVGR